MWNSNRKWTNLPRTWSYWRRTPKWLGSNCKLNCDTARIRSVLWGSKFTIGPNSSLANHNFSDLLPNMFGEWFRVRDNFEGMFSHLLQVMVFCNLCDLYSLTCHKILPQKLLDQSYHPLHKLGSSLSISGRWLHLQLRVETEGSWKCELRLLHNWLNYLINIILQISASTATHLCAALWNHVFGRGRESLPRHFSLPHSQLLWFLFPWPNWGWWNNFSLS